MGLREGDRLTITRSATVWLTQYDALKPHVSLTRELGADVEADRADMERICYVELRRAILDQVRTRRKAEKLMGDEMRITPLLKHCEKVIRAGYEAAPEGSALPQGSSEVQTHHVERDPRRRSKGR